MKKIYLLFLLGAFFLLFSCASKKYEIEAKPTIIFKTTMGDIKIGLYKKAAPVSADLFLKLCKNKAYVNAVVDEIFPVPPMISLGSMIKGEIITAEIRANLMKEVIQKNKKIEKHDLLFHSNNEVFGFFSIYEGPEAIEAQGEEIIFGKVIEGDAVLAKILDSRIDANFKPIEAIKILDVQIVE